MYEPEGEIDMSIIVRLDQVMANRKIASNRLAEEIGISPVNLSLLKNGKVRGIRFNTLEALCRALDCQPGDLLEFSPEDE